MTYLFNVVSRKKALTLTNLEAFVFDPLFEWHLNESRARSLLNIIEAKLNCCHEVERRLETSGLIEKLINASEDTSLLSRMYIGWGAFL